MKTNLCVSCILRDFKGHEIDKFYLKIDLKKFNDNLDSSINNVRKGDIVIIEEFEIFVEDILWDFDEASMDIHLELIVFGEDYEDDFYDLKKCLEEFIY